MGHVLNYQDRGFVGIVVSNATHVQDSSAQGIVAPGRQSGTADLSVGGIGGRPVFAFRACTRGGDFATTTVDGEFSVAYLVRNTIMNLTTQDAQVACFRNVAPQIEPGGCFVIEVLVPGLQRLPPGQTIQDFHLSETKWGLDEYDVATQGLISHHFTFIDETITRRSVPFRYAWPAELDLMAQLAGMGLRERWSSWKREPFTSDSREHVSVWRKPER